MGRVHYVQEDPPTVLAGGSRAGLIPGQDITLDDKHSKIWYSIIQGLGRTYSNLATVETIGSGANATGSGVSGLLTPG